MSRIALLSVGDADDVKVWSGIPYHVKRTLVDMGITVVDVSPLAVPAARLRHLVVLRKTWRRRIMPLFPERACVASHVPW